MIFVIGNGASRKNVNLDVLKQHGKIIGCNALYRDFTPDHLFSNDSIILHEILSSDYSIYNYKLAYLGDYNDYDKQFTYKWNDDRIGINWPQTNPILSERDK